MRRKVNGPDPAVLRIDAGEQRAVVVLPEGTSAEEVLGRLRDSGLVIPKRIAFRRVVAP